MGWFAELSRLTFTRPSALWIMAAVAPLIILHLARARARRHVVPDLSLWEEFLRQDRGAGGWQHVENWSSLLLRLALLAAAAMAAAGATLGDPRNDPPGITLAIVIDTSPSMRAIDVPERRDRIDAARALALDLVRSRLDPIDRVWTLSTGGLVIGPDEDPVARQVILEGLTVDDEATHDLAATVELAWNIVGAAPLPRVIVIGDGGAPGELERAREVAPDLLFVSVGTATRNVAITAIQLRPATLPADPWLLEASVVSYSDEPESVRLNGGATSIDFELPVGGARTIEVAAPADQPFVWLTLESRDAMPFDDRASCGLLARRPMRVLLVADGDEDRQWSAAALGALGDLIDRSASGRIAGDLLAAAMARPDRPDAVIVAGGSIDLDALDAPTLLLGAAAPRLGVVRRGEIVAPAVWSAAQHPLLAGISFAELAVERGHDLQIDSGFAVLVSDSESRPLLATRTAPGGVVLAVSAFAPAGSNLGHLAAFPLLVRNFLLHASESANAVLPAVVSAGEPIRSNRRIMAARPVSVHVADEPASTATPRRLPPADVVDGWLEYSDTRRCGLFTFEIEGIDRHVGVNRRVDAKEARIAPRAGNASLDDVTRDVSRALPHRALWGELLIAALIAFALDALIFALGRARRRA